MFGQYGELIKVLKTTKISLISPLIIVFNFFFFQAEDGIRVRDVTGVQTCASSDLSVNFKEGWQFWHHQLVFGGVPNSAYWLSDTRGSSSSAGESCSHGVESQHLGDGTVILDHHVFVISLFFAVQLGSPLSLGVFIKVVPLGLQPVFRLPVKGA